MKSLDVALLAIGTAALALCFPGANASTDGTAPQAEPAYGASSGGSVPVDRNAADPGSPRPPEPVLRPPPDGERSEAFDAPGAAWAIDRNFIDPQPLPRACQPHAERHDQVIFCWLAKAPLTAGLG
jgi:hypothetical protein